MRLSLLASGSKGNCCYVETTVGEFLIDVGMSCTYIEEQLKSIDKSAKNINAVFITSVNMYQLYNYSNLFHNSRQK